MTFIFREFITDGSTIDKILVISFCVLIRLACIGVSFRFPL